ncbi:MAG: hypothetical protein AAF629_30895 [Chloroflexota bacterium]
MMKLVIQRETYEMRFGHFVAHHDITMRCAQAMLKTAKAYITTRAETITTRSDQQTLEVERLLKFCSLSLEEQYTGRVGNSIEQLNQVFNGRGNLREMMAHIWAFANKLLCADLVGRNKLPQAFQIADEAGLNVSKIQTMLQQARAFKSNLTDSSQLDPKNDFFYMPWHPVRQAQETMRVKKPVIETDCAWSQLTRREFEASGGIFSEVEQRLTSGLGPNYVPWIDARNRWGLEEDHSFVQTARRLNIPMITGVSGMTMQFMQLASLLNVTPLINVRLACLGYLLSTKSHSFHEVMVAAESFGCPYRRNCDYWDVSPLTAEEIKQACGTLPSL